MKTLMLRFMKDTIIIDANSLFQIMINFLHLFSSISIFGSDINNNLRTSINCISNYDLELHELQISLT